MNDLAKIEEICHAVLQLPLDEREAFLCDSCGGDEQLQREVESLLKFEQQAKDFIESPPQDLAASLVSHQTTVKIIGQKLNHYQIIEQIGIGGMGEVYLAEDTKLQRKVALKLLPPQFSRDEARRTRFEREARAVSALNHPNIITIHDIEEAENLNFIATELIEGKTLREMISETPLTPQQTIEIAIQVASALESAHSVGIIHRDIKPANIMIRQDGIVKVLDFGLVKLQGEEWGVRSKETNKTPHSLLLTPHQTNYGVIMGTLNYMSPEQIQGKPVDTRTDIFSLGVVMYEMLSGVQPFTGNTDEAIYMATISKSPKPLHELQAEIPLEFEKIINRALAKNADERYQTIKDLRDDLQRLREFNQKSAFQTNILFQLAAVLVLILLGVGVYFYFFNRLNAVPTFTYSQLTSQTGEELFPSLSPDGKAFLYASRENGNWDIYLKQIDGSAPINLTKNSTADEKQAVFSPDGNQIVFRSERDGGGIFVMNSNGENVKRITNFGFYPNWSPDGKEIVFGVDNFSEPGDRTIVPSQLWRINVETNEKQLISEQDAVQPSWSPNGRRIAFWRVNPGGQRDIWTISADGGEPTVVTNDAAIDWNPVWSKDGKFLYFVSNRSGSMNLWQVAIDENSGKVSGNPEPITIPSNYSQFFNFSPDGNNFVYVQTVIYSNIFKIGFDTTTETVGKTSFEITKGSKITTNPDISADNQFITFDAIGDKQEDIFVAKADGSEIGQFTNDIYKDRAPIWSPDGKSIAFFSNATGKYEGYVMNADGSGRKMVTNFSSDIVAQVPLWSPDGKRLLFNTQNRYPVIFDPEKSPAEQTPQFLPDEGNPKRWFMARSWSSDGKKLVGYGRDPEKPQPYLMIFDLTTNKYQVINDFGARPDWLADNRQIVFYFHDKIYLLDTITKRIKELLSVAPYRVQAIALSRDNRSIYYAVQKSESDIWLAQMQK